MQNLSTQILSDITVHMKYAKYLPEEKRRETWEELVYRNKSMHKKKFPELADEIDAAYRFVYDKKVLPSMRSMQFAGKSVEINPARIFNCFSRDTRFVTKFGVKSFEDFEHGDKTTVLTHKGNWKNAIVRCYGKQKLNLVTFKRGRSTRKVKVTGNHRWILKNGEHTTSLKEGDVLFPAPNVTPFNYYESDPLHRLYWCYGYVYGDGGLLKDDNGEYKYSMVRLCGKDKNKYADRFKECQFKSSSPSSINGDLMVYTGTYLKTTPDLEEDSTSLIEAFMDGFLCADGTKNDEHRRNSVLSPYSCIMQSRPEPVAFLETALEVCKYYVTRTYSEAGKKTNYGTISQHQKAFSIASAIGTGPNTYWKVDSIEEYGKEKVWCLEVEDDHSFVLTGGLVTGNCAYVPADDWRVFSEVMFLLLGGTGVGYSVQQHHVAKLPEIVRPNEKRTRRFLIGDSIEGWADAVKVLMKSYFYGGSTISFDYSDIRVKGSLLVTSGGKAPGPQPLKECLLKIRGILDNKEQHTKLTCIEVHDIICHIADAVLAGGIRRAALISLFSADDDEMISCKSGNWWELNPQRGRANNSAVLARHRITEEFFMKLWKRVEDSNAREPGIYFTNNVDWGTNPCCFVGDTNIQTDTGTMTIKDIVSNVNAGETCLVETYNEDTGKIELKTVKAGILTKKDATIVKLTVEENGVEYSVKCTSDHRFFTNNRGWIECKDLTHDDDIVIYNSII